MFLDKNNNEIILGSRITNGYKGGEYLIIEYKKKLYADNGSHMFPLDSKNYDLTKYKVMDIK